MRETDSIPRLHHLVPHLGSQLAALADGATFEECRLLYVRTTDRLASKGKARRVASRVDNRDAFWSSTQEVLYEAMRLGLLVHQPLPSARRYVDEHRDRSFELTSEGLAAARLYKEDLAEFTTMATNAAIQAHPYFRAYLRALDEAPIVCPVVSEGVVAEARRKGTGTRPVAERAVKIIEQGFGPAPSADDMLREMMLATRKRFGKNPDQPPLDKKVAEALTDGAATAALRARELRMGPTDLKTLRTWGTELLLVDQSRYVPCFEVSDFPSPNVIWLAGEMTAGGQNDPLKVERRGMYEHGREVARALIGAYWTQAEAAKSSLVAPYLPIYRVRAQAAYDSRVTRKLVDRVIEALVNDDYPELDVEIQLHLGAADRVPPSEPVYSRGRRRRFQMTMHRRAERGTHGETSTVKKS